MKYYVPTCKNILCLRTAYNVQLYTVSSGRQNKEFKTTFARNKLAEGYTYNNNNM